MRERAVNAACKNRSICSLKDLGTLLPFLQGNFSDKAFFYFLVITKITEGLFEGKEQ